MSDSPALTRQSELYPPEWQGKVPRKVRMLTTVRSDIPIPPITEAIVNETYDVWVNSLGAVSAILSSANTPSGRLGLKPGEFEVIEWHPTSENSGEESPKT